jgi:Glycosyltransferase
MVRDLGIEASVPFVGWSTQTPVWYAAADIVALNSDREGTPLALIEAAFAGRPVVATDAGGVADIVADGITGFVVAPEDEMAFADRLGRLIVDADLRRRFGAAAHGHAAAYDSARMVDDLDQLYREGLVENTGGR